MPRSSGKHKSKLSNSPRDNFYQSIMHGVHIPFMPGYTQTSLMAVLQKVVHDKICAMPTDPASPFLTTLHARFRSFHQCLEEAQHLETPTTSLKVLKRIADLQHPHQIPDIIQLMHHNGSGVLFTPQYDPDLRQPEQHMIYYRITDTILSGSKQAKRYVHKLFSEMHQPLPRGDLIQIESRITEKMPEMYELQSSLCYNPLTEDQLSGDLTWLKFYGLPHRFQYVSVDSVAHFEHIGRMMHELPMQDWRDYLTFRWLHFASDLYSDTYRLTEKFIVDNVEPDESKCRVETACGAWWQDASQQFIDSDRMHLTKARRLVQSMVVDMKDTLRAIFEHTDWEPSTKREALRKLENMRVIVGWPDEIPVVVKPLPKLDPHMPFDECVLRGYRYQNEHIMENNGTASDRRRWRWESCTVVNAFYSREANVAYLPPALFYPPFLFTDQKDAADVKALDPDKMLETYCAMGSIIAHEMYHAFDYDSRYIDADGVLRNWWAESDEKHYMENIRKTIQLYNKHQHGSSRNTLSENVADLMGLRLVWQTFLMRWRFHHDRPPTEEEARRFFKVYVISQAQIYKPNAEKAARSSDLHALAETRINVPLSTFTPFLELYNVTRKDKMYTPVEDRPDFLPVKQSRSQSSP